MSVSARGHARGVIVKSTPTTASPGMGRSLYRPSPANTIEDYNTNHEFFHSLSETHYAIILRNGAYYQGRWQIGSERKGTKVEELKIDYTIGSGTHADRISNRMASGVFIELASLGW
jgi:hypothetical protein